MISEVELSAFKKNQSKSVSEEQAPKTVNKKEQSPKAFIKQELKKSKKALAVCILGAMCTFGGTIALIVIQTVTITSEVPYFEIPSDATCQGQFLLGADVVPHFSGIDDYYTFLEDLDKCPSDVCIKEECPKSGSSSTEMFKVIRFDNTNEGKKFNPVIGDQRLVYVDELTKDEGTKQKLSEFLTSLSAPIFDAEGN